LCEDGLLNRLYTATNNKQAVWCRHEQRQLHEARSQVADLWAVMASFDQEVCLVGDEEAPSAPDMDWDPAAISMPEPAQDILTSTHNSTSV